MPFQTTLQQVGGCRGPCPTDFIGQGPAAPDTDEESYLSVRRVTKKFGRFTALGKVSFQAERGEFLCVLGPSGCGKTTLLRVIAGLEKQDSGQVLIDGRDLSSQPTSRRNIGIVFQSYALFPNLTAGENIAYGLRSRIKDRNSIRYRVHELLHLVGMPDSAAHYPAQLSGGQQQRVALARAMALSPALLLLDEPLSALDAQVRIMLRSEIRELQRRLGVTTLMVTHDQEEALTMADGILVMEGGAIVQVGAPLEIYDKPANPFVASFIGSMNFIESAVTETGGGLRIGPFHLRTENGADRAPGNRRIVVAIRPEDVLVGNVADGPNTLRVRVRDLEFRGSTYRATLELPPGEGPPVTIQADIPTERIRRFNIVKDTDLMVYFPPDRIRVYTH